MSQADFTSADAARVAAIFQDMLLANFCGVAATTLLFYDYVLTFAREVRCIWHRRFSGATILFLLNRYLTLVYRVLMTVETFPLGKNPASGQAICTRVLRTTQVLSMVTSLVTTAFTSLRMYAIWCKDYRIFAGVLFLGLVPIGVNMFYYTKVAFVVAPPPLVGCADMVNMTSSASEILGIFNCSFAISADAIVLILTCVKTLEIKRSFAAIGTRAKDSLETLVQPRKLTYASLIQRDGTIYFLALLILNVVDLVAIKNQAFGSLPALTEVLTSILISRFLLDLRSVYLSSHELDSNKEVSPTDSRLSSILFARHSVAGNLGAPLEAILSNPEERCEQVAAEETAYVSVDPLAMGLQSSPGVITTAMMNAIQTYVR